MKRQIKDNCTYFFSSDVESMMAAVSILSNNTEVASFFDETKISTLKEKYCFLADSINLLTTDRFSGMLGFLTNIDPDITIEQYKDTLLSYDKHELLQGLLWINEPITEQTAEDFYTTNKQHFKGFLGCRAFFNETKRLVSDFCDFAAELRHGFNEAIIHTQKDRDAATKIFEKKLAHTDPLEFSQELMGKTFFNRGPYKHFYFTHSLFLPHKKPMRYFSENQLLFYPLYTAPPKEEDMINNLRVIGDGTRFKILLLLKTGKTLRGIDIAAGLGLTAPTISHHISELRNAGLIHEEQTKNTKYYSINTNRLTEIINMLQNTLK